MLSVWRAHGWEIALTAGPRGLGLLLCMLVYYLEFHLYWLAPLFFAGEGPERPAESGSTRRGAGRGPPVSDTGRGVVATEPLGPSGERGDAHGGGAELRGGARARSVDAEPTDTAAADGVRVVGTAAASSVAVAGPVTMGELRTRENHLIDASTGAGAATATSGRRTLYIHSQSSWSHLWNQEQHSESSR